MVVRIHPEIYGAIWIESKQNDLSFYLLAGLIQTESAFNPHAIGDSGESHGLCQLHVRGAGAGRSLLTLHDISANVRIGAAYLAECIRQTGNVEDGLSAYNQGLAGWRKNGRQVNVGYVLTVRNWETMFELQGVERMTWPERYVRGIGGDA